MKTTRKIWAIILCFMMPLIGLTFPFSVHDAFAQGSGGQGGLGTGMIISPIGLGMGGYGFGLTGMGTALLGNALGSGLAVTGMGALGALTGVSLMGGGGLFGGDVLGGTGGIGLPYFNVGGGFGTPISGGLPYMGQGPSLYPGTMLMPGQGFGMFPGINPMMPYMNIFYDTGLPSGYGGSPYYNQFGSALGNLLRYQSTNVPWGVPLLEESGQLFSTPLYSYGYPGYINVPGTISFIPTIVVGYVYDDENSLPLEGVQVRVEGRNPVTTNSQGFYQFVLPSSKTYAFTYTKTEYVEEQRTFWIPSQQEKVVSPVRMGRIPNKDPIIAVIPPIEVIAGDIVDINPYDYAYDPDGDEIYPSLDGNWVTDFPYVTSEEDIGSHKVTVIVEDDRGAVTSQEVLIIVYPWYQMNIYVGFNLISYPFEDGDTNFTAFDLLRILGDASQIDSIVSCPGNGEECQTAWYDKNGDPNGDDFTIEIGQGYKVYAYEDVETIVFNKYTQALQVLNLDAGINLVGIASYPEGYTSYDLLTELGYDYVQAIYRFNPFSGTWSQTYWYNSFPSGDIFPILMGEGYKILMKTDLVDFGLSRQRYFAF